MFTRNIKCGGCGHEGKMEAHDTVNVVEETQIFRTLGKDPSSGLLLFKCPSYSEDIAVDPLKAIGSKQMIGYPKSNVFSGETNRSNRHVPIIMGILLLVGAVFTVV